MIGRERSSLRDEAQQAWDDGQQTFAAVLPRKLASKAGALSSWPPLIAEVESVGWVLTFWAVAPESAAGFCAAYPLFRRPA